MPGKAFQSFCQVNESFDILVRAVKLLQGRLHFQGLVDCHFQAVGHKLGYLVGFCKAHAQGASHIAHHAFIVPKVVIWATEPAP
jgi:hypothetical protein